MISVIFVVKMSPYPYIGQMMRGADLCDGVSIARHFEVTWKDGEIVDDKRKELAKQTLKMALERLNYDCYSVEEKK